ncbi:uncharacterized protein LY89DRAFT_790405 [Mollisia scopiformis]|uniref:Uncharacterized protein n=1 Tax=Mollisia scopiformis TaxID=149040 RepID=A0A132B4E7_MOLSC|nr:uncharacterized protein LY89DRAFT_790405 [Mollisia scopiformis]KUJ06537.1 hypothetical protein LY89DRAFT_790405 [Mollisia scopiformis]
MSDSARSRRHHEQRESQHFPGGSSSRQPTSDYPMDSTNPTTAEQAARAAVEGRGRPTAAPHGDQVQYEDPMDYEQSTQPGVRSIKVTYIREVTSPRGSTVPTDLPGSWTEVDSPGHQPDSYSSRNDAHPETGSREDPDNQRPTDSRRSGTTSDTSKSYTRRGQEQKDESMFYGGILSLFRGNGISAQDEKKVKREVTELKTRNQKLTQDKTLLAQTNQRQSERLSEVTNQSSVRFNTIARQKEELTSLRLEVKQLKLDHQGMEDQIRTAQLAMSKKSSKPKIDLTDEERTIKGNFMNLHDEVRKWAKRWGSANFSVFENLSPEKKEIFLLELGKVVTLEDGCIPQCLTREEMSTRTSVLCVSALLGRYICAEVLDAPFRPLRSLFDTATGDALDIAERQQISTHSPRVVLGDGFLEAVYQRLSDVNRSRAQVWRSDLMSILDPSSGSSVAANVLQTQEEAADRRAQAARDLTSTFLNTAVSVLLPDVEPEQVVNRHEELQTIFRKSLDMAGRLWKQLTIVKCTYLEDLKQSAFNYDSDLMDAHAFHKLGFDDEDEDEHRLDNHLVRIMVFPAIKAYGNSDGEKYTQDRVWGKAIVWLDE